MSRFAGVERQNRDFYDRYHDIERENNNLANLYVASFQLHSTMDLREVTQIILEILLNFVGAKTFAIQLVDEEQRQVAHAGGRGRRSRAQGARGRGRRRARRRGGRVGPAASSTASGCARAPIWRTSIARSSSCRSRSATRSSASIVIWDLLSQKTALADVDYELFNLLGRARRLGAAGREAGGRAEGPRAASVGRRGSGLGEPCRLRWSSKIPRRCGSSSCSRCAASAGSRCSRPTTASTRCASWPRRKLDIILTDINMPIMDGLKLVKRVRSDEALKDIPIIIITTEGAEEDRQRALALGANAYITKPIQAPQVIAKVKELLKIT